MADDESPRPDTVAEVVSFLKIAVKAEQSQRDRERDDLAFQVPENAWTEEAKTQRAGSTVNGVPIPPRPMLALATLDEPIQLVENQYRDAHLGVNIHPLSAEATDDTAQVLQGIYRSIEVHSRASQIPRAWGFGRALRAGRGAYRVISEYDPDTGVPGDQRLLLKRILYQESVFLDPFAEEPDWSDGERAAIVVDVPVTTYRRKYKKKGDGSASALASYDDGELMALGRELPDWVGGEGPESRTVRVAEFFYVEHEPNVMRVPGAGKDGTDLEITYDQRQVKWVKVNGVEELERGEWPGPYIPIVPTIGKELIPFNNSRRWIGMISNAKDSVRLVNYAASGAVEMAALEPKAPWQMEEGQDEGFEWEYQQANIRNFPVLHSRRKAPDGQPYQSKPARVQVDASRLGPNMALLSMGRDFLQSATQTYDASLGKTNPAHRSGEAIKALQGQSTEGTSNYIGNIADVSMTLEAMIMLWAIPHFYDRPGRIVQILDGEDKPRQVMLNQPYTQHPQTKALMPLPSGAPQPPTPPQMPPQPGSMLGLQVPPPAPQVYHYDLKKGRYGVTVTIGKSDKSKLEQGESEIGQIMQSDPALVPLIGPVYFKYRDGPGMKEIGKILQKQRDHMMPWLSDDPSAQPTSAQVQQLTQQHAQMAQQIQALTQTIQTKQVETQGKFQIAQMQENAETQRAAMDREVKIAVAEIAAQAKQSLQDMALFYEERARIGAHIHEQAMGGADAAHNVRLSQLEHQQSMVEADQTHAQDTAQSAQDHSQTLAQGQQANTNAMQQNQQQADLQPPPAPADQGGVQ